MIDAVLNLALVITAGIVGWIARGEYDLRRGITRMLKESK